MAVFAVKRFILFFMIRISVVFRCFLQLEARDIFVLSMSVLHIEIGKLLYWFKWARIEQCSEWCSVSCLCKREVVYPVKIFMFFFFSLGTQFPMWNLNLRIILVLYIFHFGGDFLLLLITFWNGIIVVKEMYRIVYD